MSILALVCVCLGAPIVRCVRLGRGGAHRVGRGLRVLARGVVRLVEHAPAVRVVDELPVHVDVRRWSEVLFGRVIIVVGGVREPDRDGLERRCFVAGTSEAATHQKLPCTRAGVSTAAGRWRKWPDY